MTHLIVKWRRRCHLESTTSYQKSYLIN